MILTLAFILSLINSLSKLHCSIRKRWYRYADGEYCWDIQQKFSISADNFNEWNPSVGSDCGGFWKDVYVCVRN
jgi:hypothetical protein